MTPEQQADVISRCDALAALVGVLRTALQMRAVYEDFGDCPSEIVGARQAAKSAMDQIDAHLTALGEYAK